MRKGRSRKPFGEQVVKLIAGVNLEQMNMANVHVFLKPVGLHRVMLGMRGHAMGLQTGKGKCTNIVLMNLDMHVGKSGHWKANLSSKLLD